MARTLQIFTQTMARPSTDSVLSLELLQQVL